MLESFTDYTHIFTDGSKDGDKTAAAFICQSFEFSKRLPDKASIFTAELEAIVSALRYIKITTKNNKFVVFGDSKSVVPCGSGAFSLEEGRIAPLPLPRHVVRGDYLECSNQTDVSLTSASDLETNVKSRGKVKKNIIRLPVD